MGVRAGRRGPPCPVAVCSCTFLLPQVPLLRFLLRRRQRGTAGSPSQRPDRELRATARRDRARRNTQSRPRHDLHRGRDAHAAPARALLARVLGRPPRVFEIPPERRVDHRGPTPRRSAARTSARARRARVNRSLASAPSPSTATTSRRSNATTSPIRSKRALEHARERASRRRSVDLIYAIPGQTLDDLKRDLERGARAGRPRPAHERLQPDVRTKHRA